MLDERLRFDLNVAPGGYAWWYFDAESPDGRAALTIIAFVGSVFSPYYAWSGRQAPQNHCALNVALYGAAPRWSMTERSEARVRIARDRFEIGASALSWKDDALTIEIEERAAPLPFPLRGRVTVRPIALTERAFAIDAAGRHRWRPLAPRSSFEVEFDEPALCWRSEGYFDSNDGAGPLEDEFGKWNWARLTSAGRPTRILYDTDPRGAPVRRLAIDIDETGSIHERESPPLAAAPATPLFQMTRLVGGEDPKIVRTLEDAPFYSRSLIETTISGARYRGFHESLSGDRLRSPIVRAMLPFRMPRHDF